MNGQSIAVTIAGLVAAGSAILAGLIIWLLLTEPVTVANAVGDREMATLFQAVVGAIYQALSGLVRYL